MPIPVQCPHCSAALQVADKFAGCKIRCPKCKAGVIEIAAAAPLPSHDLLGGLDDVFAAETSLAPPPKRRRSSQQQAALRGWLVIGAVLMGVVVLGGVLIAAGSYAWQMARQLELPDMGLPNVAGNADGPPSAIRDWKLYRSTKPPFEIYFPTGEVSLLKIGEGTFYTWTSPVLTPGDTDNLAILGVCYFPRKAGESDRDAIHRVEKLTNIGADGTSRGGIRVSSTETTFQGMFAIERTLSGTTQSILSQSILVAHSSGVYSISGVADPHKFSLAQLRAMRSSFRIVEESEIAAESQAADRAAIGGVAGNQDDWQIFRPEKYPIVMKFPIGEIRPEQVSGLDQFRWTGPPGQSNPRELPTDFKLIVVPRAPNVSDAAAIETAKQRVRPLPPDSIQVTNIHERNALVGGRTANEVRFEIPSRDTQNIAMYVAHPKFVFVLLAIAEKDWPAEKWIEMIVSVEFRELSPGGMETPDRAGQQATRLVRPWELFRSEKYPIQVLFPDKNVNEIRKGDVTGYMWVSDEKSFREGEKNPNYALLGVMCYPRLPNEADGEATRRVIQLAGVSRDGAEFRGAKMQHAIVTHDSRYAVEIRVIGDTSPVIVRGFVVAHPTGVYHFYAVVNTARFRSSELTEMKKSFRFTD